MKMTKRLSPSKLSEIKSFYFENLEILDNQIYKTFLNISLLAKGTVFFVKLPMSLKFGKRELEAKVSLIKLYVYAGIMSLVLGSVSYLVYSNLQVSIAFGAIGAIVFYGILYKSVKKTIKKFNFFVDSK